MAGMVAYVLAIPVLIFLRSPASYLIVWPGAWVASALLRGGQLHLSGLHFLLGQAVNSFVWGLALYLIVLLLDGIARIPPRASG
jgi:hypothetical protein